MCAAVHGIKMPNLLLAKQELVLDGENEWDQRRMLWKTQKINKKKVKKDLANSVCVFTDTFTAEISRMYPRDGISLR